MKIDSKIDSFIKDVISLDKQRGATFFSLRKSVLKLSNKIREEIKYGGIVFIKGERLFCGIFPRKGHISLEFDRGAELNDKEKILEGSGKGRRHLKILGKNDIKDKKAEFYIRACYKLTD